MCTMSWFKTVDGYELFFNRDERKTRRRADIPAAYKDKSIGIISPTDADAGGTWISVNQFGVSFCLLNHYEKEQRIRHIDWLSRGGIIRALAKYASLSEVESAFAEFGLQEYKPFRLFVLDNAGMSVFFTWDGDSIVKEYNIDTPRSSSSYNPEKVRSWRKQQFALRDLRHSTDRQDFLDFHSSHHPAQSAYSVCMHRDDASTVSLSHIVVNAESIAFSYADGSPCEAPLAAPLYLAAVDAVAYNAA